MGKSAQFYFFFSGYLVCYIFRVTDKNFSSDAVAILVTFVLIILGVNLIELIGVIIEWRKTHE